MHLLVVDSCTNPSTRRENGRIVPGHGRGTGPLVIGKGLAVEERLKCLEHYFGRVGAAQIGGA